MIKKTNAKVVSKTKVAAGVAGLAAIGAGAYYLLGPKGKEHQKKAKTWMTTMQKEVVKRANELKSISAPTYKKISDELIAKYGGKYQSEVKEMKTFLSKLKKDLKQNKTRVAKAKTKLKKEIKKIKKS